MAIQSDTESVEQTTRRTEQGWVNSLDAQHSAPELSVVIVTLNEADRIATCIESVLAACRHLEAVEVILVDSRSTDATVDVAKAYPVRILRLPPESVRTPGAGRHVGTAYSRGDFLLFVDGDMRLSQDWLPSALEWIRTDGVAGVDGQLNEPATWEEPHTVDSMRGVALYEREALESVGGFDPYLESLEDVHLGYQLTAAGYRLLRLPSVAAQHPERDAYTDPLRRFRQGYMFGLGQVLRRSLRTPSILRRHLSWMRFNLLLVGWLLLGLFSAVVPGGTVAWVLGSLLGVGVVISRLGPRKAIEFLVSKGLGIPGILVGLTRPLPSPELFPLEDVECLQRGSRRRAGTTSTENPYN